jgi:hypothetical protein
VTEFTFLTFPSLDNRSQNSMENPVCHILKGTCMTNVNTCKTFTQLLQILDRLREYLSGYNLAGVFSPYYKKLYFICFFAFLRFSVSLFSVQFNFYMYMYILFSTCFQLLSNLNFTKLTVRPTSLVSPPSFTT